MKIASLLTVLFCLFVAAPALADQPRPDDFVDVQAVIPTVVLDIRYSTPHNFLGVKVDGYEAPKCYLTKPAAEALARVQEELAGFSLSLKLYDCYRPQRAVNHFVRWAEDIGDVKTKGEFYPRMDKSRLFVDGFIAKKSGHSRGSTVDLTIVPLPAPPQEEYVPGGELFECQLPAARRFKDNGIDMGTGFDCFSELSHTRNPAIGPTQRVNRLLLASLMDKHGFDNYRKEWWHYTLRDEPYKDKFFDFPIN
ncbi:MAG: M15 family metallopeptidase [Pseudomonadota bacterium]